MKTLVTSAVCEARIGGSFSHLQTHPKTAPGRRNIREEPDLTPDEPKKRIGTQYLQIPAQAYCHVRGVKLLP